MTRFAQIVATNLLKIAKTSISLEKVRVSPLARKTCCGNSYRLQNTASSQLLNRSMRIVLKSLLRVIWFDAAYVMRRCVVQG